VVHDTDCQRRVVISENLVHDADHPRVGVSHKARAEIGPRAMRVFDIENLGYSAAIVTICGERILLMDVAMNQDERVSAMLDAMADLDH
jgi:hypothetical protein